MILEIFIIQKLWLDPLENEIRSAFGYEPTGFVETEDEAVKITTESRLFDKSHCWALDGPTREFTYIKLQKF